MYIHAYTREREEEGKKEILQNKPKDERLYWKLQNTEENLKKFWKATHGYELAELHIIVNDLVFESNLQIKCNLHQNFSDIFYKNKTKYPKILKEA